MAKIVTTLCFPYTYYWPIIIITNNTPGFRNPCSNDPAMSWAAPVCVREKKWKSTTTSNYSSATGMKEYPQFER